MRNTRCGVVYQRAGHVDRNPWSRCRNPPVTIAGMTGHVPGISGHVGPEYAYGQCTDCGTDIATNRLEVAPEASRCLTCQDSAEHHEHHG